MNADTLTQGLTEILANQVDLRARIDALEYLLKAHFTNGNPMAVAKFDATLQELREQRREDLSLNLEAAAGPRLAALVSQALEKDSGAPPADGGSS